MKTLAEHGEDRLVAELLARLPRPVAPASGIVAGAGDDCAVVAPLQPGTCQLLKTDCVIEGVHYLAETEPERVGWKALCRPLSDIAAMAGKPLHALVTLALPGHATVEYACGIYTGLGRAAERFGVQIVGGETARSPGVGFLSVALTGTIDANQCVTRAGGHPGHLIYVTGRLGGSFASGKHLDFVPRLDEAQWLASHYPISSMMDLSDGIGHDLPRLARASGTGYAVDPGSLPRSPGCSEAQALSDGEDYELLFTVEPQAGKTLADEWRARWPALELTCIGTLCAAHVRSGISAHGGYDHFHFPA